MTKKEAKAVLDFNRRVLKACDSLVAQLGPEQRQWAEFYYITNIRYLANGQGYGSAPIMDAIAALER